jgi:protein-disulfide isomerase
MKQEVKVLLGIGLTTLLLMFGAVWFFTKTSTSTTSEAIDQNLLIKEDSPTMGPSDAKVTIVEFLDPECESCRAMYPVVKDIMAEYEGKVRLVVRYFPLHSNSVLAATVTEAAGEQGKYWEMQQKLFENQSQWGEKQTPQRELFIGYATELGLDQQKFEAALSDPKYATKIQRDQNDGKTVGVKGTPTFFINGQRIETLSVPAIKAKIDEEINK